MVHQFDDPTMGGFTAKEHLGRLVMFERIGHPEVVKTAFGDNNAVRADVTVLDTPEGPTEYPNSLIFGAALVPIVSRSSGGGRILLGRVAQGVAPRPGQDPPWILSEASPADKAFASQYLDGRDAGRFASPAAPQPAPPVAATPAPVAPISQVPAPAAPQVDLSQLTPEQLAALLKMQQGG